MLDNIESGYWTWKGNNWVNVSEAAKTLIMSMMCPDPEKRWSAQQCLESEWIVCISLFYCFKSRSPSFYFSSFQIGNCPEEELGNIQESIKQYQAKKKLKGAILGVMATNSLLRMSQAMAKANAAAGTAAEKKPPLIVPKKEKPKEPATTGMLLTTNPKFCVGQADPILEQPNWEALKIKIIKGTDLAARNPNGKSDPYLKFWCGQYKYKVCHCCLFD